jgi:beta-1,4-mannosyl-glycoprotein beta-1,4-N-acetylglucosaminyltransferase
MVIDTFMYNGEADILELRLSILNEHVDQFIICEAETTFSGQQKPLYYLEHKERYSKWAHKILYHVIEEDGEDYNLASTRSYVTNQFFERAFVQKEGIKKSLTHLKADDKVFYGDVDEIWQPSCAYLTVHPLDNFKLPMYVYSYYLNNRSSEEWYGTHVSTYGFLKDRCLNDLRSINHRKFQISAGGINNGTKTGWHFTNIGGIEMMKRKLESYDHQEVNTQEVKDNLIHAIADNKDFLGRDFTFWTDETDWPQYLKDNKTLYNHLCK